MVAGGDRGERPAIPETRLKILHVTEAFGSGVFEAIRIIANTGAEAGHSVHVAHSLRPWTPTDFAESFDRRVSFHRLRWASRRDPRLLVMGTADLHRLLRSTSWDVIHFHSTFAGVAGALVRPRRTRTVYSPHGYAFLMSSASPVTRTVARMAEFGIARRIELIGAVSEAEALEARRLGAPWVEVIHNGISELDHVGDSEEPVDNRDGVVAVGRMAPQRQPGAVARIFAKLPTSAPKAWIGDAQDTEAARALSDAGVNISGWLPRDQVLERLRAAKVYLHWTAWDGQPLSVLEAISQGTVVVAHDIPPVREVLGPEQVCGTEDLAVERIRALLQDEDHRAEVRELQLERAERFSGATMTSAWNALYSRMAAG